MSATDCWAPGSLTASRTDLYAIFLTSLVFCAFPPVRKSIKLDLSLVFFASSLDSIKAVRFDVEDEDLQREEEGDGD